MDRLFQILAVILVGVTAYFLWTGSKDGAFVAGVLGCVAFFLSVRFQAKERNRQREEAERKQRVDSDQPGADDSK